MEDYIKASNIDKFLFPAEYKQIWEHQFSSREGLKVNYVYIKNMTSAHGLKSFDEAIAILKFLYKRRCATLKQLSTYVELKGLDPEKVPKIMQDFVFARACNRFTFARNVLDTIPEDAFMVYTLDFGAKTILSHFGENDAVEWVSSEAIFGPEIISKYLAANQFFLEVLRIKKESIEYYNPVQTLFVGTKRANILGEFSLVKNDIPKTFLLDIYREGDYPAYIRQRAEMFDDFYFGVDGKNLQRYYNEPPVLLLVAPDESLALDVLRIYYRINPNLPVRILTDDFTLEGISGTSFYKYDKDNDSIIRVRSSYFE